jgi:guanosine-3',5'-bis(diphosphate) 3'-pyrophosphohydrolase
MQLSKGTMDLITFSIMKHEGQMYGEKPYSYHLHDVYHTYHYLFGCPDDQVAMLIYSHDLIEDTDTKYTDLMSLGLDEEAVLALELLTKPKGMDRDVYIRRVLQSEMATKVKKADSLSNLLHSLASGNDRLINKYTDNLKQLYRS